VCGALLVFSQGASAEVLGVALFTVAAVASQVTGGLVIDRFGLGPGGPQHITVPRVLGAGLAVVSVVVAVSAKLAGANASWLVVLPALAGIGLAWQQAVNGRVKQTADSAVTAAAVNFATGTGALILALVVELSVRGLPRTPPAEAWLYVGGVLGIFVIGGAAVFVRYTGVLVLSMGMVAGQLAGALLLDLLVPAPGTRVETSTLVGIVLTLLAAWITAFYRTGADQAPTGDGTGGEAAPPVCHDEQP
jgi:bacterial/archaeal transporter family-2 protein